jgi:hypothetical protein
MSKLPIYVTLVPFHNHDNIIVCYHIESIDMLFENARGSAPDHGARGVFYSVFVAQKKSTF